MVYLTISHTLKNSFDSYKQVKEIIKRICHGNRHSTIRTRSSASSSGGMFETVGSSCVERLDLCSLMVPMQGIVP